MDQARSRLAALSAAIRTEPAPALVAAAVVIGSPLAGAILFRTYGEPLSPPIWEFVRRFEIFFRFLELLVVALACRAGLGLSRWWNVLKPIDRAALLIWLATFWIGTALSPYPLYSWLLISSWPVHGLFGIALWYLARQSGLDTSEITDRVATGMGVVLAGLLLVTAVHFLGAPDPSALLTGKIVWAASLPGFQGVRLFGVTMIYAAVFGAGLLLVAKRPKQHKIAIALLVAGVGAAAWSGTRAAAPAFAVALFLAPVMGRVCPSLRSWAMVLTATIGAIGFAALVPSPDPSLTALLRTSDDAIADPSSGRMELWQAIWMAIIERPWFGHGEGATLWLLERNITVHVQPHNVALQLLLHWGAIATGAAVWLGSRLLLELVKAVRAEPILLPYAMLVVAAVTAALFDGALYYSQMLMMPIAALAFSLSRVRDRGFGEEKR
jgi:exopolysaccharide production protein ExoQ